MIPFSLAEPESFAEARALLDPQDLNLRVLAGGTALMLLMRSGLYQPERLVSLRAIEPRYREIEPNANFVRIGAMASLRSVEQSAAVADAVPVLARAMRRLSNVRVRNVATLGGHLAHGDPHMDLPAILTALQADVVIVGRDGERRVSVESLYRGYFETALAPDDLISEVQIPLQGSRRASYIKCTTRSADDWPALGIAVVLTLEAGCIAGARIVVGAATDRPTVVDSAGQALIGASCVADEIAKQVLDRAGEAAAADTIVRGDARGSAPYKRELVRVYVRRAVVAALRGV